MVRERLQKLGHNILLCYSCEERQNQRERERERERERDEILQNVDHIVPLCYIHP